MIDVTNPDEKGHVDEGAEGRREMTYEDRIMQTLRDNGACTTSTIARQLGGWLDMAHVRRVCKRLEQRGIVITYRYGPGDPLWWSLSEHGTREFYRLLADRGVGRGIT